MYTAYSCKYMYAEGYFSLLVYITIWYNTCLKYKYILVENEKHSYFPSPQFLSSLSSFSTKVYLYSVHFFFTFNHTILAPKPQELEKNHTDFTEGLEKTLLTSSIRTDDANICMDYGQPRSVMKIYSFLQIYLDENHGVPEVIWRRMVFSFLGNPHRSNESKGPTTMTECPE